MIKVALSAWMDTPFKKDLSTQCKMTALWKLFSIPNYLFSVPCSHSACWHFIISIFPDNVSVWCATRWTVASLIEWATAHSCQPSPQRYSNISGHSVVTTIIVKLTSYYDVLPGRVSPTPSAARGSADLSSMGKQSQTSIRHQSNGSTKSCAVNHGRLPAEKKQGFPPMHWTLLTVLIQVLPGTLAYCQLSMWDSPTDPWACLAILIATHKGTALTFSVH